MPSLRQSTQQLRHAPCRRACDVGCGHSTGVLSVSETPPVGSVHAARACKHSDCAGRICTRRRVPLLRQRWLLSVLAGTRGSVRLRAQMLRKASARRSSGDACTRRQSARPVRIGSPDPRTLWESGLLVWELWAHVPKRLCLSSSCRAEIHEGPCFRSCMRSCGCFCESRVMSAERRPCLELPSTAAARDIRLRAY